MNTQPENCPICGCAARVVTVHTEKLCECSNGDCGALDRWAETHMEFQPATYNEADAVSQWNAMVAAYRLAQIPEAA